MRARPRSDRADALPSGSARGLPPGRFLIKESVLEASCCRAAVLCCGRCGAVGVGAAVRSGAGSLDHHGRDSVLPGVFAMNRKLTDAQRSEVLQVFLSGGWTRHHAARYGVHRNYASILARRSGVPSPRKTRFARMWLRAIANGPNKP